jgi:uncharacterized membrane protein YwaF
MKEFFGFGGYTREPEGYMSWQHLLFVTTLMVVMVAMAVFLGRRYAKCEKKDKNKVLVWTAIIIDACELFKILICGLRSDDPLFWTMLLPLFLCSIQLITIPMAAFCRGRLKEAALDFVLIFGILGAVLGTYGAGQNYNAYPVLGFDNVISGLTHSISGFASLYIAISGLVSMKKRNIWITFSILGGFCAVAYVVNVLIDYNYMFLMAGDGTPYDIFFNLVGGHPVLYPLIVVILFLLYITAFYWIFYLVQKKRKKNA